MIRNYSKRVFGCIVSLALFGFGSFLGVKAGSAGTNAWNTLSLGMQDQLGISFGTATLLVSGLIIVIDLLGKGKVGVGSILNVLLIPFFSDLFLNLLAFVPAASEPLPGALLSLAGQTVVSFATVFYMLPALGCGPRDTLMILVGKRFPKVPIGTFKFAIEAVALLAGALMGAPVGLGTVLVMVLQASIFQLACRICRYEPRSIVHEDLMDTFRRITGALKK